MRNEFVKVFACDAADFSLRNHIINEHPDESKAKQPPQRVKLQNPGRGAGVCCVKVIVEATNDASAADDSKNEEELECGMTLAFNELTPERMAELSHSLLSAPFKSGTHELFLTPYEQLSQHGLVTAVVTQLNLFDNDKVHFVNVFLLCTVVSKRSGILQGVGGWTTTPAGLLKLFLLCHGKNEVWTAAQDFKPYLQPGWLAGEAVRVMRPSLSLEALSKLFVTGEVSWQAKGHEATDLASQSSAYAWATKYAGPRNCQPISLAKDSGLKRMVKNRERDTVTMSDDGKQLWDACYASDPQEVLQLLTSWDQQRFQDAAQFRNANGWTALHVVCLDGHVKLVEMLLKHGADAEAKNYVSKIPSSSFFPYDGAPVQQDDDDDAVPVVEMLLKHGVDTKAKDKVSTVPPSFPLPPYAGIPVYLYHMMIMVMMLYLYVMLMHHPTAWSNLAVLGLPRKS
ncbi:uncharacterized protein MONBRDRAFT_32099 [Monosiga brevicollis MX1]|uniref:Uncharacterized protein n=1 Tax=Monosiga brevicollis TaxID=81824 RepID=A9UXE7_MONBE|nr:uncharacterized protein MONBRDRAFT_32099 [Monosiga brevicollis MX1]EDQ90203.1 predicted protein [Monosiga brevicollis MX1]|eukprot:XP_001744970.1 hypothetical protein [Monosiga brevicollis MX1]